MRFRPRKRDDASPKESRREMDRSTLLEHLAQAERRITEGNAHIRRQHEIVIELARDGDAEELARGEELLAQLEEMQAKRLAECNRIIRKLGEAPAGC
jgi:hypothetical protein